MIGSGSDHLKSTEHQIALKYHDDFFARTIMSIRGHWPFGNNAQIGTA